MIVYHVAKTEIGYTGIRDQQVILPGKNVHTGIAEFAHISLNEFSPGSWALDVIGADTNEAWIFTLDIPDDTELQPDPSGDGDYYNGGWVVHKGPLAVKIVHVEHIQDVCDWESGTET